MPRLLPKEDMKRTRESRKKKGNVVNAGPACQIANQTINHRELEIHSVQSSSGLVLAVT